MKPKIAINTSATRHVGFTHDEVHASDVCVQRLQPKCGRQAQNNVRAEARVRDRSRDRLAALGRMHGDLRIGSVGAIEIDALRAIEDDHHDTRAYVSGGDRIRRTLRARGVGRRIERDDDLLQLP
jgi:hypothetical protein